MQYPFPKRTRQKGILLGLKVKDNDDDDIRWITSSIKKEWSQNLVPLMQGKISLCSCCHLVAVDILLLLSNSNLKPEYQTRKGKITKTETLV